MAESRINKFCTFGNRPVINKQMLREFIKREEKYFHIFKDYTPNYLGIHFFSFFMYIICTSIGFFFSGPNLRKILQQVRIVQFEYRPWKSFILR